MSCLPILLGVNNQAHMLDNSNKLPCIVSVCVKGICSNSKCFRCSWCWPIAANSSRCCDWWQQQQVALDVPQQRQQIKDQSSKIVACTLATQRRNGFPFCINSFFMWASPYAHGGGEQLEPSRPRGATLFLILAEALILSIPTTAGLFQVCSNYALRRVAFWEQNRPSRM